MATKKTASKRIVSDSHKAAMAAGRENARHIKRYLEALETHKPKRGRKVTTESLQARLTKIEEQIATADPLARLGLVQDRLDIQNRLAATEDPVDFGALEDGFAQYAKAYSDSKGISYAAWRELGVSPALLKRAGITRSGS